MIRLLLIFLLVLTANIGHAQEYIYAVTTGTAWARRVYPEQEKMQRKLNAVSPVLEDAPQFSKIFSSLKDNYRLYNRYNDSIFINTSKEEWVAMFHRRARIYSSIYEANNLKITEIKDYFARPVVPEAAYDSLYYWMRNLYFSNFNDVFFYEHLLGILEPHYEELQDVEHLIFCYLCSGTYTFQCSRMGDVSMELTSKNYFEKILAQKDRFIKFQDPLNRYYFISAFINLAILHSQAGNQKLEQSCKLVNEMRNIYRQPETQEIFRNDSLLNEYSKWSTDLFRFRGITMYISHGLDKPQLRDYLYSQYREICDSLEGDFSRLNNRYYAKLPYDHLMIEAFMGKMSWDNALKKFESLLAKDPDFKSLKGEPKLKITYLNNLAQTYLMLLSQSTRKEEAKKETVKLRLDNMLNIISHYNHALYPFEKGTILANLATKPLILKYLNSEERRDLLFRLVLTEQPTTYVHASMVAELSVELASAIIETKPDYFVGVPGYYTIEDVVGRKEKLLAFIRQAALYHDLGKISMPNVINNCFRKLTDHEFELIKLHPDNSEPFFMIDNSLKPYLDVALGHHKWYDGDGYPKSFHNRLSPYFSIINVVTLCDCMDAATENIGRNYHQPKSFEKVLSEFDERSGELYDPYLISLIHKDKKLYRILNATVNIGRINYYHDLYGTYFNRN